MLEQKNKGRARVKIAVFFVLTVHGIGLLALLMQGCNRDDTTKQADQTNNAAPSFVATNMPAPETNLAAPGPATNTTPEAQASALGVVTEYTIIKGDSYSTLAGRFHVTSRAIADANPGVEPTKLQIGQKIKMPPPVTQATPAPSGGGGVVSPNGEEIYSVKSGDSLTKIAVDHHTTVKALRAANDLKSDSIKVGQKLKIPAKGSPEPAPASTSAPPAK